MFCYGCMERLAPGEYVCHRCGYDNSYTHNDPTILNEGSILNGKYMVGRKLGRGGFGVTYLGLELNDLRKVAIKEYFPHGLSTRSTFSKSIQVLTEDENESKRFLKGRDAFQKEAKALGMFKSRHIVQVRHYFTENNTAYIVMDYVEGPGLNDEIKRCGKISWQRTVNLMMPLIREMDQLHQKHLIHRDIKPENIKVVTDPYTGEERLVLLDFGAARTYTSKDLSQNVTQILTPGFAPYEQYLERTHLGPYTDIYALCATMYNMITGEKPPAAPDLMLGDSFLPYFINYNVEVPEKLETAIRHGMEVRYQNRTQSLYELYNEMRAALPGAEEDSDYRLYQDAQELMRKDTIEDYREAMRLLELIPEYRDSERLISDCLRNIEYLSSRESAGDPDTDDYDPDGYNDYDDPDQDEPHRKKFPFILVAALAGLFVIFFVLQQTTHFGNIFLSADSAYTRGHQSFLDKDYDSALPMLKTAAEKGSSGAMVDIGRMYYSGWGVEKDYSQAYSWFEKAAGKNDSEGQRWMGVIYANGRGVDRDYAKAYEWYKKAADQQNAAAMNNIGSLYLNGNGVEKDYAKAYEWYKKAADLKNYSAMLSIGSLYQNGYGFDKDFRKAEEWYLNAVTDENSDKGYAEYRLGSMYGSYNFTDGLSDAEKSAMYAKSREWYQQAADDGYGSAWLSLGNIYFIGTQDQTKSYEKALYYYQKGAEAGNSSCLFSIAEMYYNGFGVELSYEKSAEYLKQSADLDNYSAWTQLGLFYEFGIGVEKNQTEAKRHYQYAANSGSEYTKKIAEELLNGSRSKIPTGISPLYQEALLRASIENNYSTFDADFYILAEKYALMDLDSDGTDELIIGYSDKQIKNIFRIKNGYKEDILLNIYNSEYDSYPSYYLCENQRIRKESYTFDLSEVSSYNAYYKYSGGEFTFIEALVTSKDYDYYYSTTSEISLSGSKLSYSERSAINDRYTEAKISWVSLK